MYILIETADRETGVLQYATLEEARKAMHDCFMEVLEDEELMYANDNMKTILDEVDAVGYYEDDYCGMSEWSAWYNRARGGHLDWLIEKIDTSQVEEAAVQHYWDTLHSVMKMKSIEARDLADKEDDYDSYNSGWLEGQYAGLKEATRTIEASTFLFKERS